MQNERVRWWNEVLLKLLFKGKIAAVDERIQLQRRLAPKLQGVTLCKKKNVCERV